MPPMLRSNICNQAQMESPVFRAWAKRLGVEFRLHRKLWEFCYISQALEERGLLVPGKKGLAFGVGREPLVAFFARTGCEIVATDLDTDRAKEAGWVSTNQHAANLEALNEYGICPPADFRARVSFRTVDMNEIPSDLADFDFTWSSCSLEHLGSIDRGARFIENSIKCLKPGGVAVHTTEYNVSSNTETIENNDSLVLFRKRDIRSIRNRLMSLGHGIKLDLRLGNLVADNYVDVPPYKDAPHLRLQLDKYVSTSIGLVIEKGEPPRIRSLARKLFRRAG